jgi:Fe-S-cluster containining protein
MNAVDQLCPNCGLCCDGTLFADVELRAGDDAKRLAKLGLAFKKKGQGKLAFAQPCACFDGTLCKIYTDRPKRCRLFECGLLKKVNVGEMKAGAALKKISRARARLKKMREMLDSPAQRSEKLALIEAYKQAMQAPVDLTAGNEDRQGELMRAFEKLMGVLQRDFLTK